MPDLQQSHSRFARHRSRPVPSNSVTKYSESSAALQPRRSGRAPSAVMGCYAHRRQRTLQAVIEQCTTRNGIIWPLAVAPYHEWLVASRAWLAGSNGPQIKPLINFDIPLDGDVPKVKSILVRARWSYRLRRASVRRHKMFQSEGTFLTAPKSPHGAQSREVNHVGGILNVGRTCHHRASPGHKFGFVYWSSPRTRIKIGFESAM